MPWTFCIECCGHLVHRGLVGAPGQADKHVRSNAHHVPPVQRPRLGDFYAADAKAVDQGRNWADLPAALGRARPCDDHQGSLACAHCKARVLDEAAVGHGLVGREKFDLGDEGPDYIRVGIVLPARPAHVDGVLRRVHLQRVSEAVGKSTYNSNHDSYMYLGERNVNVSVLVL